MRSRSCALHSDSPEEFLRMAQASLNSTGLFYDERLNRRVMARLPDPPQNTSRPLRPLRPLSPDPTLPDPYSGFEFSLEIQVDRQEKKELERKRDSKVGAVNVGIISNSPTEVVSRLSLLLGQTPPGSNAGARLPRDIDLVVASREDTIYKFWVFSREALGTGSPLVQTYLDHCGCMFDAEEPGEAWKREEAWIVSSIPELLI